MRRLLFVLAVALLGSGCAQNAMFELQVQLPANPPGETWFAQIQVRDQNGHSFSIPWMGGDVPTVALGSEARWDCISVESLDPTVSLHVRVRFCHSEDCLDLEDGDPPERLYSFEAPFYIGSRTYYRVTVPRIPSCTSSLDCAVGVCIEDRCGCSIDADCGGEFRCEPGFGCVNAIDRCSIEGCIEGPVSATFCSTETGEHFCERNPEILRDETFMCSTP